MGRGSRVAGRGLIVAAGALFVACSSTAHAPTSTVELRTVAPSTPTAVLSSDLSRTIENVVLACREKDAAALRSLVAQDVTDQQIDSLFGLGRDVVLRSQTPTVTGDQASVAVGLEIQRATGTEDVSRTWHLSRGVDGLWRFAIVPDCY